jgi:hypothetical protein
MLLFLSPDEILIVKGRNGFRAFNFEAVSRIMLQQSCVQRIKTRSFIVLLHQLLVIIHGTRIRMWKHYVFRFRRKRGYKPG